MDADASESEANPASAPAEAGESARPRELLLEDQRVPLRLTASRGALGLELYERVELGPLGVSALSLTLPGLKFPIDLSGGVPKFRHRRGELEHVTLELELERLESWAGRRVAALLGPLSRAPALWPLPAGLGVGLLAEGRALAFDLLWAPDRGDARFVVANARGVGLELPALGLALRVLDTALGRNAERRGRAVRIASVGERLGRLLLPAVGARAPTARAVRFAEFRWRERRLAVTLDSTLPPAETGVDGVRALELSELVHAADDELAAGNSDKARAGYVAALERAPRHPELVRLIAEIDARVAGRAEAALGLLVESLPATHAGVIGAELLAAIGDAPGARQAIEEVARREPFAPLASLAWLRLAELEPDAPLRVEALDRAVAASPGLTLPRSARLALRVRRGDVEGALSDAEHLEALGVGARARHEACSSAARLLLDAGYVLEAGKLFERALRYLPDDPSATLGLARALVQAQKPRRALSLLERALALSERVGRLDADALIDLARLLADELQDLPQAIARVRQVSASSERIVEARYLEGSYRARLGDRVGAALAFGRLREAIELSGAHNPAWTRWLVEAAEQARHADDDALSAERHLALALRLAPRDPELAERYRAAAARVAELAQKRR